MRDLRQLCLGLLIAITSVGLGVTATGGVAAAVSSKLNPPQNLRVVVVGVTQIQLAWQPPASGGPSFTNYIVKEGATEIAALDPYTTSYLVTGLKAGKRYRFSVETYGPLRATRPVHTGARTASPASATVLTSCGDTLSSNSHYVLTSNITWNDPSGTADCFDLSDLSNTTLDCEGHSVTVTRTFGFPAWSGAVFGGTELNSLLIANCTTAIAFGLAPLYPEMNIDNANSTYFNHNDFGDGDNESYGNTPGDLFGQSAPDDVAPAYGYNTGNAFVGNTFDQESLGAGFQQSLYVGQNTFTFGNVTVSVANQLDVAVSEYTTVDGNTMSNTADYADYPSTNVDDNINFTWFTDYATVYNNTLSGTFDANIEPLGSFMNSTILDNTLDADGIDGIGAYWETSWVNDTVEGNKVTQEPDSFVDGNMIEFLGIGLGQSATNSGSGFYANSPPSSITISSVLYWPPFGTFTDSFGDTFSYNGVDGETLLNVTETGNGSNYDATGASFLPDDSAARLVGDSFTGNTYTIQPTYAGYGLELDFSALTEGTTFFESGDTITGNNFGQGSSEATPYVLPSNGILPGGVNTCNSSEPSYPPSPPSPLPFICN